MNGKIDKCLIIIQGLANEHIPHLARLFTYALAVEHTHIYYNIYVYKILLCIENVNDIVIKL